MLEGKLIFMESVDNNLYFIGNYIMGSHEGKKFGSVFRLVVGVLEIKDSEVILLESDDRSIDMYFKKVIEANEEVIMLIPLSKEDEANVCEMVIELYDMASCFGREQ